MRDLMSFRDPLWWRIQKSIASRTRHRVSGVQPTHPLLAIVEHLDSMDHHMGAADDKELWQRLEV
eukprot:12417114-Karenia_brevis.AAC.1